MDDTPTVTAALAAVMAALPAIGKDSQAAPGQGGYNYRGIEQITAHVQPLFAQHGIVMVPRVESAEVTDVTVAGKPWTDTKLMVAYDVYGPGGTTDRISLGPIFAIGRDNSDKGANKAMTQAFKYALLQLLCISDSKDDGDQASPPTDEAPAPRTLLAPADQERFAAAWVERGISPAAVVAEATGGRTNDLAELYADEAAAAREVARRLYADLIAAPTPELPDNPEFDVDPEPVPEVDPEAVLALVNGVKSTDLDGYLQHLELPTTGNVAAKRQRLGVHLLHHGMAELPDWPATTDTGPQQTLA